MDNNSERRLAMGRCQTFWITVIVLFVGFYRNEGTGVASNDDIWKSFNKPDRSKRLPSDDGTLSDWHPVYPNPSRSDEVMKNETHLIGVPKFIQQPHKQYYAFKNHPAEIVCVVEQVNHVTMFCADKSYAYMNRKNSNGLVVEKFDTKNRPDPEGIRWKFSVRVSHKDVVEWFGKYICHCEAWNNLPEIGKAKKVVSVKALVSEGYFERKFVQVPIDVNQESGKHLILACRPPEGKPEPEVFWMKNNEIITREKFPHLVVDDYKQLIINHPRPLDSGNYTCVAKSMGIERRSPPGKVTIYVNGRWSSWSITNSCPAMCQSKESECSPSCISEKEVRERQCNEPFPANGGALCEGPSQRSIPCGGNCRVDGGWSSWSSWSKCKDCQQHRKRECSNPLPRNKGKPCSPTSDSIQMRNCTTSNCVGHAYKEYITGEHTEFNTKGINLARDIAMYVGMFIAIIVFITVVIVIGCLIVKRSYWGFQSNRMFRYKARGSNVCRQEKDNRNASELLIPPDLTQTVITIKNPNAVDIHPRYKCPGSAPDSLYRVGPLPAPPSSSIYMSIDGFKPLLNGRSTQQTSLSATNPGSLVTTTNLGGACESYYSGANKSSTIKAPIIPNDDEKSDTSSRAPSALYHELSLGRGSQVFPAFIPSHLDPELVAWGTINSAGGRLCLPASGISLTIPQGAIPTGESEDVFLAVCRDDKDRPRLPEHQTLLSPVILCGPSHLNLLKSAVLSFPHCAYLKLGGWLLTTLNSDSPPEETVYWQSMVTLGRETLNTPIFCQLDVNSAHIMTDQLQRFSLVGESIPGFQANKALRLAAFAAPLSSCLNFNIRVYVIADTKDALEHVVSVESKLEGRLLDNVKQLNFKDSGHKLCFCIEELSLGWRSRLQNKYQEIPFSHVWNGNQSSLLHCSFTLEHIDPTRQSVSCKIVAYQDTYYSQRLMLNITNDKSSANSSANPIQHPLGMISDDSSTGLHLDPLQTVFRIPNTIRPPLCNLLDTPNLRGNDWRLLARQLGVDRYINYFATKPSPTDAILDLWEARNREENALPDLKNSLRAMGRIDAANLLENDKPAWL